MDWKLKIDHQSDDENVHNIVCTKSNDSGSKSELVLVVGCWMQFALAEAHEAPSSHIS